MGRKSDFGAELVDEISDDAHDTASGPLLPADKRPRGLKAANHRVHLWLATQTLSRPWIVRLASAAVPIVVALCLALIPGATGAYVAAGLGVLLSYFAQDAAHFRAKEAARVADLERDVAALRDAAASRDERFWKLAAMSISRHLELNHGDRVTLYSPIAGERYLCVMRYSSNPTRSWNPDIGEKIVAPPRGGGVLAMVVANDVLTLELDADPDAEYSAWVDELVEKTGVTKSWARDLTMRPQWYGGFLFKGGHTNVCIGIALVECEDGCGCSVNKLRTAQTAFGTMLGEELKRTHGAS